MIETSSTTAAIAAALSKAQAAMGGAVKDSANPFFKSSYADLESVTETVRKPAADNDLSWVQSGAFLDDGSFAVVTLLMHKSGEWIRTTVPMRPKDMLPQNAGSAMSYGRRYGLAALFGVYQTDDDGNVAHGRKVTAPKPDVAIPTSDVVTPTSDVAPPALDEVIRNELEIVSKKGVKAFRAYWKELDEETQKAAHGDKEWFDGLRATAEGVGFYGPGG